MVGVPPPCNVLGVCTVWCAKQDGSKLWRDLADDPDTSEGILSKNHQALLDASVWVTTLIKTCLAAWHQQLEEIVDVLRGPESIVWIDAEHSMHRVVRRPHDSRKPINKETS